MDGLLDSLLGFDIPPIKIICAYRFQQHIIMHDHIFTSMGIVIPCSPYLSMAIDTSSDIVGQALWSFTDCLNSELDEIKNPINWPNWWKEYLQGLKIGSIQELYKNVLMLRLELYGDRICFLPTHNYGSDGDRKGFQLLTDKQFSLMTQTSTTQVGHALFQGFELCTTS